MAWQIADSSPPPHIHDATASEQGAGDNSIYYDVITSDIRSVHINQWRHSYQGTHNGGLVYSTDL